MAENYDLIFGQGASSQYAWSDSDYQNGWKTVGSTPPTAEQFDALQRRADLKAQELNNRLATIEENDTHDYRQPSTAYVVGDIAYHASLPTGWCLECTAGGTTSSGDLTISSPSIGGTVSDGTVQWQIRKGVTLPYELPKYMETLLDDKDAATARATLGTPSTTGANASGSWNINAATASKLASPRKINITGNASGSANFDGSGDVSINTTVNESKHAATATTVNATAPNGGAADLAFGTMAINDYARIRVYGKDDNGALEIATADGGNEPIYARQYSGNYDWPNGRPGTVTNEAAILDSNGNTKFPKNVTAASFTGPLKGNADTASKLNTVGGGTTTFNWVSKTGQPNWLWGGNNSAPTEQYVYNPSNFHVAAADKDGNGANIANTYLKKSGGNMSGPLNFANATWNLVGDDSYIGDHDIVGTFCVKGANGETGIALVNKGNENDYARISYGGGNINFSKTIGGNISGNSATATKLATPRTISLTGNASGSANFDGSGNVSISTTVNESKHAADANKLASESGSNYVVIDTNEDSWSVIGSNPGSWLKSIRINTSAPPYSLGYNSAAVAFGGGDTKGIITHAYGEPNVKFAGGNGSTANWKFTIQGGSNNEVYNLNNFPTKTGGGASGTWGINISGNAATATKAGTCTGNAATATKLATARSIALTGNATGSATFDGSGNISISTNVNTATNADKLDGYHASDLISKIYPVGSIYISVSGTNPASLFGIGTWVEVGQGRTLWGADSSHAAGSTIEAGLPNITGTLDANNNDGTKWKTGAFYDTGRGADGADGNDGGGIIAFDASRSNAIYGKSSTVQPPALVVHFWKRTA